MSDNEIHALLEAHEAIIVEREEWKHITEDTDEDAFSDGHVNGLNEARNRIEEIIRGRCEVTEADVAEHYREAVEARQDGENE